MEKGSRESTGGRSSSGWMVNMSKSDMAMVAGGLRPSANNVRVGEHGSGGAANDGE